MDKSGINSLGGFSYQIKVFILKMLEMNEGMQTEFETIDDVASKTFDKKNIDENDDYFQTKQRHCELIAYQVKRTKITKNKAIKILLNWILLEKSDVSEVNINQYELITDSKYKNKNCILDLNLDDLFNTIQNNTTKNSLYAKVNEKFKNDKEGFLKVCNSICKKYTFTTIENIDEEWYYVKISDTFN